MAELTDLTWERELRERARQWCKSRGLRFHESIPAFAQDEIASLQRKFVCLFCGESAGDNPTILCNEHAKQRFRNWENHRISLVERAEKAEAELASARQEERERCKKDICIYCQNNYKLDGTNHRMDNGVFLARCYGTKIHERAQAEGKQISNSQKGESPMKYDIEAISAKVHE